ncbi:MAG: FecR domain-containing protein [Phycisphaerae bacterium]|nr:FecR domain-containing protein [Saprospiraceae bacterium]
MEYTSDIDELIAKHLTGEMAAEEQALLEKWLVESPDNRQYFDQMQRLWQKSDLGKRALSKPLDVEDALLRTKAKIQHKPVKAKVVPMAFWRYAAAAVILLLVGAFWFFQQNADTPTVQLAAAENPLRDTLSDGSVVSINQYSSLSATFTKKSRQVKMKGEAYFEVAHNASKPFVIEVQQVQVTVVGTKFNIDNRSDPNWVIVSVVEGKVRVQSGGQSEFLTAGEQARIDCQSGQFIKTQTKPSGNESAWANHQFKFEDTPLSEVIPMLEKAYNVKINLTNKELENCHLSAPFNNQPIERIIVIIAETFSLEIKHLNGQYFLDGPSCDN